MPGSLRTEAIVLRSIRYGEADRILHLYTPDHGRVSAIAKGARRTRSRFGARLEPFFHLRALLYQGRSDLLTVTRAETLDAHGPLRERAASLDAAARACDAVARLFETDDPSPAVFHLLANELRLLDDDERDRRRRTPARLPPQAARRRRLHAAAGDVRLVRRGGPPQRLLRRGRRRRLQRVRGVGLPALARRRTRSSSPRSGARSRRRRTRAPAR